MQKFNKLTSIPAYLPMVNIDTDMIIPKQFLKTIKRTGLGKNLFFEMRYDDKGNEIKDFILNKKPFNQSKILIAGKNFGCGSSREHAPWALLDFGITCVISSSYADIFYNNCFKNGILPIKIDEEKKFKNLTIKPLRCKNSKFDDNPDITAYLQVKDLTNKNKDEVFNNCAILTSKFETKAISGRIGIIGPKRLNYVNVKSILNSFRKVVQNAI